MTGEELFRALSMLLAPGLERLYGRRDLCIIATRVAIDVGEYFGVEVQPLTVRAVVYNRRYEEKLGSADPFDGDFSDGSWAVGVGYGKARDAKWAGHLIASTDELFGDFSIGQAERPHRNILTGPGIFGPYAGQEMWQGKVNGGETIIEYRRIEDESYRRAPDWRDDSRRRPIVAALIRTIR
jgi:hypothetical protein